MRSVCDMVANPLYIARMRAGEKVPQQKRRGTRRQWVAISAIMCDVTQKAKFFDTPWNKQRR